jgi:hypothetical protein
MNLTLQFVFPGIVEIWVNPPFRWAWKPLHTVKLTPTYPNLSKLGKSHSAALAVQVDHLSMKAKKTDLISPFSAGPPFLLDCDAATSAWPFSWGPPPTSCWPRPAVTDVKKRFHVLNSVKRRHNNRPNDTHHKGYFAMFSITFMFNKCRLLLLCWMSWRHVGVNVINNISFVADNEAK